MLLCLQQRLHAVELSMLQSRATALQALLGPSQGAVANVVYVKFQTLVDTLFGGMKLKVLIHGCHSTDPDH